MLEPPPLFSSFNLHRPPGPAELHHSTLLDGRWIEVSFAHVKELDPYHEAKKRLSNRAGYQPNWQTDLNEDAGGKAKGKETKNGGNNNKDNKEGSPGPRLSNLARRRSRSLLRLARLLQFVCQDPEPRRTVELLFSTAFFASSYA